MNDLRAIPLGCGFFRAADGAGGGFAPGLLGGDAVHGDAIADGGVTLGKIANLPAGRILGRKADSAGPVQPLTGAQATALLNTPFVYDTLADLTAATHPVTAPGARVRVAERVAGQGGGADYRIVAADPGHPLSATSNGGAVIWDIDEQVLTPEMAGAVGDGVTDDGAALQDLIDCLGARGGGEALFTAFYACAQQIDIIHDDILLRGAGQRASGVRFTAQSAGFHCTTGWRFVVDNMLVSGEFVADYCFRHSGNNANPEIRNCRVERAEKACVFYDWETTAWKIVNSTIALAGDQDAAGVNTPGAHAVHARCIGEIAGGSILTSATGHLLYVEGSQFQEETRVNMIGGRLNSGFDGLLKVDSAFDTSPLPADTTPEEGKIIAHRGVGHNRLVTVNLIGTYLENPGSIPNSAASASPEASVHAVGAGARINVEAPLKHLIRNARHAYLAEDGAEIHVRSRGFMARAQALGSAPKAVYARAGIGVEGKTGRIVLGDLPSFWDDQGAEGMSDWLGFLDCPGSSAGLPIAPERLQKVATPLDGGSIAGLTASAGTLALATDAANRLTGTSSIRLTGSGANAPTNFRFDWSLPAHLAGHSLMALAVARFKQVGGVWGGATGAAQSRFQVDDPAGQQAGAAIFPWRVASEPTPIPAPGAGVRSDWWFFPVFFQANAAVDLSMIFNLDTTPQSTNDIAYVDAITVYAIDGGLAGLD